MRQTFGRNSMITADECFRLPSGRNGFEKALDFPHQSFMWIPKLWQFSLLVTKYARVQQSDKICTSTVSWKESDNMDEQSSVAAGELCANNEHKECNDSLSSSKSNSLTHDVHKEKCLVHHWNMFKQNMATAQQHKPPHRLYQQILANDCDYLPLRQGLWNLKHILHANKRTL